MEMYKKYKQQINYLIFGGLTTLINIVTYIFFYDILAFSNLFSNIMAWIFSVLFAYVTNKLWVFESKTNGFSALLKELSSFVGCRLATGVLDIVIMYRFSRWSKRLSLNDQTVCGFIIVNERI